MHLLLPPPPLRALRPHRGQDLPLRALRPHRGQDLLLRPLRPLRGQELLLRPLRPLRGQHLRNLKVANPTTVPQTWALQTSRLQSAKDPIYLRMQASVNRYPQEQEVRSHPKQPPPRYPPQTMRILWTTPMMIYWITQKKTRIR